MAAKGEQQSQTHQKKKHTINSALIALCIIYILIFSLVFLFVLFIYTCTRIVFTFILCFELQIYIF
jgi:hypothetical protein